MRIAHITDIHVLSLKGVNPLSFLSQRVLGSANLLANRGGQYPTEVTESLMHDINANHVDHVVVSGDLTNLSLQPEFDRVKEILELLDLSPDHISVVPGNHDCYTLSERIINNFSKTFNAYITSDIPQASDFPYVRMRDNVAIIGLSTAHFSMPLMATGSLGLDQMSALKTILENPEVKSRFRLIVMHHPPRSPYATWHKKLADGEDFIDVIAESGAELIVHGHLHRELRDELKGPDHLAQVIGSNSSIWLAEDPTRHASYNIYQIDDGSFNVERRVYDADKKAYQAS